MKATIQWQDNVRFTATSGSGHSCNVDGPPEFGGQNTGARPMELMLMGIGSCSAFDVVRILQKSRQDLADCTVDVDAKRADSDPKVFTHIHLHFTVVGKNISPAIVKRAVALSAEKYCSASLMLQKSGVVITHNHTIKEKD